MALIYIIEDDADLGPLYQHSLEDNGFDVALFTNASDAIAAYKSRPADVVICDMIIRSQGQVVPDGGLVAIWRIREIAKGAQRRVVVIAISGVMMHRGMKDVLTTAQQFGADATLEKPFPPEDLLDTIRTGLAGNARSF